VAGSKIFTRRRDGRVEVRMNDYGRSVVRSAFANVLAAERDPDHEWHVSLTGPIDPSLRSRQSGRDARTPDRDLHQRRIGQSHGRRTVLE